MTIDSLPANVAAASANVAQANSKSATDAAPIATDATEGCDPQLGAFQAIFQQLSQQNSTEKPAAQPQATQQVDAPELPTAPSAPNLPNLPNLADLPPPAMVNQQVAAELPVNESQKTKPIDVKQENLPCEALPAQPAPAKAIRNLPVILKIGTNAPQMDEPAPDESSEAKNTQEKPPKNAAIKCDPAVSQPPVPMQSVAIANSTPSQDVEQPQPVISESNGKRKTVGAEKISLPKVKEPDDVPDKEIQARKAEAQVQPVELAQQMPQEMPVSAKDDPATPQEKQIAPARLEFTLPQPHVLQKEIEQPAPPPPLPPEQAFIQANHPQIVSTIHGELLPNGGSMHIRMDPPELGALNVQIDVRDGIVTASFQTSNDEATRLLSHSLGQLRTTLESAGVSVEKLQVQQGPREHFNSNSRDSDRPAGQQAYERSAHDDRQRREILQRMWRRLTVGRDELDLVA